MRLTYGILARFVALSVMALPTPTVLIGTTVPRDFLHDQLFITPVQFYFVRHGETDRNKQRIYQGSFDCPLNEEGLKQAALTAEHVENLPVKTLAVSPMLRTRQTVAEISKKLSGASVVFVDELRECKLGDLEGKPMGDRSDIRNWIAGTTTPVNAEPYVEFKRRVCRAVNETLTLPGPILIVGHARFYAALMDILGIKGHDILPNCQAVCVSPPTGAETCWTEQPVAYQGEVHAKTKHAGS